MCVRKSCVRFHIWRIGIVMLFALGIAIILQAGTETARAIPAPPTQVAQISPLAPAAESKVFLPFIRGGVTPTPPVLPMLIGAYAPGQDFANAATVNQYLTGLDTWATLARPSKGHSIGADFKALEDGNPSYNVGQVLATLNNAGYTGFMNMSSGNLASTIANGSLDSQIRAWARAYKSWVDGGSNRRAFIAPLQEMNLTPAWGIAYGCDAPNFKLAYARIISIFESEGVTRSKIWWVFAPNGWTYPCGYSLADYYPGDALVDVVGFSSYNQSCRSAWMTPTQIFDPYIQEIRQIAPTKPIFIAQTASSSPGGDKEQWLRDAYSYLYQKGVRAVLYFNADKECDWAIYRPPSGPNSQGYKDAVTATNATRYIAPATLAGTVLPP